MSRKEGRKADVIVIQLANKKKLLLKNFLNFSMEN